MKREIPKVKYRYETDTDTKGFKMTVLNSFHTVTDKFYKDILYQYHQIDFFAILIITAGEVNHLVDFKLAQLKKDDCLIITNDQVHAFDQKAKYSGYILIFSEEFLQKHFTAASISKIPFLYKHTKNQLIFNKPKANQTLLSNLKEVKDKNTSVKTHQIGALLTYYLLSIADNFVREEPYNKNQDYFYRFQNLLKQDYISTRNAKDYAQKLNISYKHLNDICKYMANKTAKALIDDFVILEAKKQLVMCSLSVKEVGFKLGFDESTNFRKYFAKHTKTSPTEFLKKMQLVTHLPLSDKS